MTLAEQRLEELASAWKKLKTEIGVAKLSESSINDFARNAPPQTEQAFQELLRTQYSCLNSLYSNDGGVNANPDTLRVRDYLLAEAVYGKRGNAAEKQAALNNLSAAQTTIRDYWNIVAKTIPGFDSLKPEATTSTKGQSNLQRKGQELENGKKKLVEFLKFAQNYHN